MLPTFRTVAILVTFWRWISNIHLHDLHNDLPLCPDSPIAKTKAEKLIPNLFNQNNYIIHYRNLKRALALGLQLKKIHRILSFAQHAWWKPYIDYNANFRNNAKNAFEKDFFKLMNNSIFGKTIKNVDKRTDVRLATSWENIGRRLGARSLIA